MFTVLLNRLNTFSETIAQFLKTLNTNLRRVNNFVKTPQILLRTDFFHQTINTAIKLMSLREHQLNTGVILQKGNKANIYVFTVIQ